MKNNNLIWFAVVGAVLGALSYIFGGFDERKGMSHAESLEKARKAKAAKAAEKIKSETENEVTDANEDL